MSLRNAMLAVIDRMQTAANSVDVPLFSSIRAAGSSTPCWIWDVQISRVPMLRNGVWEWSTKASAYWQIELTVTIVGDSLDYCFSNLSDLHVEFDGGPYTITVSTETYKMAVEAFGPFSTEAATPDDGQQDAERSISGTISIHITEV
jgi:hypothetical protein